jgi:hypothetical protein
MGHGAHEAWSGWGVGEWARGTWGVGLTMVGAVW